MSRMDLAAPVEERAPELVGGVVVGFEGRWQSRPALWRAVDEAVTRGLPLTVLTLVAPGMDPGLSAYGQAAAAHSRLDRATSDAADALSEVHRRKPGLSASVGVFDDIDDRLRQALARCRLLVLGNQGPHGVRAFLLGTVSRELIHHTSCPILVVPDDHQPAHDARVGSVLVGLGDGLERADVLRTAGAEALRRGASLVVLHSYAHGSVTAQPRDRATARELVGQWLQDAALDPDLLVTTMLTPDPPAEALLLHAGQAELLVIGSRGPLALARLALDSVSREVLDAAPLPVLVVPGTAL